MSDTPALGVDGGNSLSQKMVEATRCTVISFNIRLNGMMSWADLTRPLTVQMKCSISGTCYFLNAWFSFIPRAFIYLRSG